MLVRAGADPRAIKDGRVFLGRTRVRAASEGVREGDVVEIASSREAAAGVRVLAHGGDLVAVEKPAGMPTIPDHGGASHALVAVAARTLGIEAERLHPTSRLDRDVSGVVVFALTKGAADRLSDARAKGAYERRYVALAMRAPDPARGTWNAPIGRARDPRLRAVDGRDAVPAATRYAVAGHLPLGAIVLLAAAPTTGRTHQIRVHAAHAGAALVGDRSYGGAPRLTLPTGRVLEPGRIALHAARVVVPLADGASLVALSPVPPELIDLWSALGGDPAAWELAASCDLA